MQTTPPPWLPSPMGSTDIFQTSGVNWDRSYALNKSLIQPDNWCTNAANESATNWTAVNEDFGNSLNCDGRRFGTSYAQSLQRNERSRCTKRITSTTEELPPSGLGFTHRGRRGSVQARADLASWTPRPAEPQQRGFWRRRRREGGLGRKDAGPRVVASRRRRWGRLCGMRGA